MEHEEEDWEGVLISSVTLLLQDFLITLDAIQSNPPNWGLDRIDQASLPLDTTYAYNYDGTGVRVYIIDTGIRASHTQFGGRVTCGINLFGGTGCADGKGHGTHVAGIIGGISSGVAKNVQLVDVNVFGSRSTAAFSTVLAAYDYILAEKKANPTVPMVINMSLSVAAFKSEFENLVNKAVAANITVVVAAGNNAGDACQSSPAYVTSAITVGATDAFDKRANYSNYGPCVDLYAPGSKILSSFMHNDTSLVTLNGTSMACPHVSGAAALYLQKNPTWTPAQVREAMRGNATKAIARIWFPFNLYLKFRRTTRLLLQTDNI